MKVAGMRIDLPSNWQWSKCNDVMDVRDGTHDTPKYIQSGYPLITSKNLKSDGIDFSDVSYISEEDHRDISKRSKVDKNDILFAMIGTIGNPVIVETDKEFSVKNVALFKFAKSYINPVFFKYLLGTPIIQRQLTNETRGGTQKFVSLTVLRNMLIPYPPLEEQKRIAAILDKADRVRRKRQEAIRLTEELGRSIFLDMFGDPVTNSKGWETCRISKIASVHRGKFTPRPRNDPRFYNGNYPFIQTGDITSAKGYLTKYKQTLNEEGIKVSRSFNPGSIVIAIVGATIGETAILKSEMYCPDSVIGITPYDLRSSEYIEYSLRYWKQIFRDQAPETARANINLETIRPLEIPCPPIELQEKFKFIYEWSFKNINRAVHQESENLFNSLLQRAFRGEL